MMPLFQYLGDGVYASFDGFHVVLTTGHPDPRLAENRVMLEPEVVAAFTSYLGVLSTVLEDRRRDEPTPPELQSFD